MEEYRKKTKRIFQLVKIYEAKEWLVMYDIVKYLIYVPYKLGLEQNKLYQSRNALKQENIMQFQVS